jgi:small-conductance mechanosensitive channel
MIDLLSTLPNEWKTWGVLIILGLPFSIIIAGELLLFLEKRESKFIPIVHNIRNILLPNLAIYLIFSKIMKLGDDSLILKVSATFFWLVLIHSTLKFVNTLMFSDVLPKNVQARIPKLLVDFSRTFLVLLGAAIIASNVWGADLGRLLAALGVGSVVLGLALQDVLGGLFSGIALLSSKPFVVGDWIKVGDMDGKVVNIDWRAVTLIDFAGDSIVVPNSVIAKERFRNFSRPTVIHRESVGFDISFDDPPNKVKQVLLEAAAETKKILTEPAPQVVLISYDEFSIHYTIHYFIDDYGQVANIENDFITRIWYANRRYGITFPTRTHEVYNFNGEECSVKEKTPKEISSVLKSLEVFSVPEEQLIELSKHAKLEDFGVGECLLQKDFLSEKVYVVLNGIAKEHIENKHGELLHDYRLKKGDLFGLASLVRREASLVTVCALSDIQVISIEIEAMKELLRQNPSVAQSLENMADAHESKIEKSLFLGQDK